MAPLKNASEYYTSDDQCWSPLWARFGGAFQKQFLARVGDDDYVDPELYVGEREPTNGVAEQDVVDYVEDQRPRLFVVTGPGGIGKTTFLHHALEKYRTHESFAFVFLNVVSEESLPSAESFPVYVARRINSALQDYIAPERRTNWEWTRHFLRHSTMAAEAGAQLLDELDATGSLREGSNDILTSLLHASSDTLTELVQLKIAFLLLQGRKPVLVIDNIDQLPTEAIEGIVGFANTLVAQRSTTRVERKGGGARVIIAMRPLSLTPAVKAYNTVIMGELMPPNIAQVVSRRLHRFLRVDLGVASEEPPLPHSTSPDSLLSGFATDLPEVTGRRLLERATALALSERSAAYGTLAHLVQRLSNFNTRSSLLALTHYVASGHLDWPAILNAVRQGVSAPPATPRHRVLKALFVGVRSVYKTEGSWLYNMFNDGDRDAIGVVIRPRLLKAVSSRQNGLPAATVLRDFRLLFQYPEERLREAWKDARERGLLDELKRDTFQLSKAGYAYLKWMSQDYNYLQHVLMDAWVDQSHLVKCRSDETTYDRYERVLKFAHWICTIEINDYRKIVSSKFHSLYEQYFGDATLAGSLALGLQEILGDLRDDMNTSQWEYLRGQTRTLAQISTLASISQSATAY